MVDMRVAIRELITGFTEGTIVRQPVHVGPGNVYFVPSDSEEGGFYVVAKISAAGHPSTWICGCRAFRFEEESKPCKHINKVWKPEPQPVFTSSADRSKSKPEAKAKRGRSSSATSRAKGPSKSSKTTASASSKSSTQKSTGLKATSKSIGKRSK